MNTIIIAAIVIIVLIVLIGIFTGYLGKWVPQFVQTTGQTCSFEAKPECDAQEVQVFGNFEKTADGSEFPANYQCCRQATCSELGGTCVGSTQQCPKGKTEVQGLGKCKSDKPVCCA